jgi:hypothetical protein
MNATGTSPVIEMGRKDSLSLNVEFVKVNISRTRKGLLHSEPGLGSSLGSAVLGHLGGSGSGVNKGSADSQAHKAANIVRF